MTTPESTHASRGYVLDTRYPETYFQALSPAWLNYARAVNGVPARSLDEPFAYLELGAGTSHSTVVHAASCPRGEFHACDFNPEHIEGGRRFASALGLRNIELHEASFEQLQVQRLPKFDFIVLHGVYSWVDAKARAAIRNIIRETLGPGGLVYVSYNCMPGWTSELPVRRMLVELAASAMKALATPGQQHLAIDFATNRRFRRDLFIRDEGARSRPDARAFLGAIIGSIEDPRRLGTGVTVPRGHITFQPDFIDELRTLLDDGAVTIADAAASLGRRTRNTTEIIRNLAFLVAGGALSPFAKAYRRTHPPEVHRPANAIVERTLAYILENRMARALPSELLGGGVPVTPLEAHAIIELLGGADPAALASRLRTALSGELRAPEELSRSTEDVVRHVTTTLLPNLARLQLVV
jgi:SAM-dependent methyltransferase